MNSKVIKLLIGLCLVLLLILLLEWKFSGSTDNQSVGSQSADENTQDPDVVLPVIGLLKINDKSFLTIYEKPLFIKGRRPVEETVETVVNQASGKIDDFVLVGIYSVDDQVTALIRGQKGSKEYFKKSQGEEIFGWTLSEIQSDRVLLESAGKQQSILLRKPRIPRKPQKPRKPRKPKQLGKPQKPRQPQRPGQPQKTEKPNNATNKAKPVPPNQPKPAVTKKMNLES